MAPPGAASAGRARSAISSVTPPRSLLAIVTIIFTVTLVPETKKKPLEQIEAYWRNGRNWDTAERATHGEAGQGQAWPVAS